MQLIDRERGWRSDKCRSCLRLEYPYALPSAREGRQINDETEKLKKNLAVLISLSILIVIQGCTFRSSQWEAVSSMWKSTVMPAKAIGFWWDFTFRGSVYKLFPVKLERALALTDGKEWILVIEGAELKVVRNLVLEEEWVVRFSALFSESSSCVSDVKKNQSDSCENTEGLLGASRASEALSIFKGSIDQEEKPASRYLECTSPAYDSVLRELKRTCVEAEAIFEYSVASFDQSGSIESLRVNLDLSDKIQLTRSNSLVSPEGVKRLVQGGVKDGI